MQVPIQLESQGRVILGMLHAPARRAEGAPLILLNYGLNGDRVDNHRLSVLLAHRANAAGISVVRFDYGGCGLSNMEFQDASIRTKTADALAVMDFIQGCFQDEPIKLVLLGYSDGIRVIHQVLKQRSDVAAIAFWNPIVRSMKSTFRPERPRRMTIEPTTKKLVFPLFGLYMGMDYLNEVNGDLDVRDVLAHNVPKLFVFGTGDVHTRQFQQEMRALAQEVSGIELREVPGANHTFARWEWSELLVDVTVSWVLKQTA